MLPKEDKSPHTVTLVDHECAESSYMRILYVLLRLPPLKSSLAPSDWALILFCAGLCGATLLVAPRALFALVPPTVASPSPLRLFECRLTPALGSANWPILITLPAGTLFTSLNGTAVVELLDPSVSSDGCDATAVAAAFGADTATAMPAADAAAAAAESPLVEVEVELCPLLLV